LPLWEDCTYWPVAGYSSEARAGVDALDPSPARKWRARGRIEHTLLDGEFSVHPNRPKTFARNPTIPQKVPNVTIYDKEPGYYMILSRIIQAPANGLRRIPLPKLSEKGRRSLQCSLTEHLNSTFRPILASLRLPIPRSECCSYPFSDSFSTHSSE
jgi:hypothetical protein